MRAFEFLIEAEPVDSGSIADNPLGLKGEVLSKIKTLPDDKESRRILAKVQDLLNSVNAMNNLESFKARLEPLAQADVDVQKAMNQLVNLLAAAAAQTSVRDRDFFFKKLEADNIVKVERLLEPGNSFTIDQMFNFYGKSPAITFIVDALSKVSDYGMGKGEVVFAVLSKRITKAIKGDLEVKSGEGTLKVEVKATDGGSPRFADQEVTVALGYEQVRDELFNIYATQIEELGGKKKTGLNIDNWIALGQRTDVDKDQFNTHTFEVLEKIFPGQDNTNLVQAIAKGKTGTAKGLYANQTYERYMTIKNDDVVMYINFGGSTPTYTIFKDVADLTELGMRFHASTIYILGFGARSTYPQMSVSTI